MFISVNSISKRLFFSFGILVFNIIVITVLALFFLWRTGRITNTAHRIDNQRILISNLIKTDLDFLRFETVNTEYFETGKSGLIDERDRLLTLIRNEHVALQADMKIFGFIPQSSFVQIEGKLTDYNATFHILRKKIDERGFKDYGVEGAMRDFAHRLEENGQPIALVDLLTLRRHEKDFILRKEKVYVNKFNDLAERLMFELREYGQHDPVTSLLQYKEQFNLLVRLNYEIGITPTAGLLEELNHQVKNITADFQELMVLSHATRDRIIGESALYFSGVSFFLIVFSLLLTYYTSMRLARPIKKLSASMGKFIINEGLDERDLDHDQISDEISALSQSFVKLSRKLRMQFNEILYQNKELKKLNAELDRFIYSAAHDLKSPLASLHGLIRLAEQEINSQQHGHYFSMMSATVKKLDGFIRDITDYAKNKRQQLKIERVDSKVMVTDILESMQFLPDVNRINVTLLIEGDDLFTDKARLEIILRNLLSNSFRYVDLGKQNCFIGIEGVVDETQATFRIKDNGIGIGNEHLNRIFDMFYRAVEFSQGTGIGLFLVKESIKMLRGKISVQSSIGEGTVFYLKLPNLKGGVANSPESEEVVFEVEPGSVIVSQTDGESKRKAAGDLF